ncbi:MAG: HEAT repeat domain-containing protein [Elusimicrobia bacterium]|nr:HEAT repeat domain-containing protein [Elusimicrobiota bacterium]
MRTIALLLSLCSAAAAEEAERLSSLGRVLETGGWNARIHAVHTLGELGPGALPQLARAAHDADWQVRMTAAHHVGRLGRPALGALETVLREEPCRAVRLTALHWLGIMGPEASDALRGALDDESGMMRLMGRYWLDKPAVAGTPPGPETEAAKREQLAACASSPRPGAAPWARPPAAAPKNDKQSHELVVTPDPKLPETPPVASDDDLPLAHERLEELDEILAPAQASAETMPAAPSGFGERPSPETAGADYARDAGTGKAELDPLPALIALLRSEDPAVRARACDDIGKRGAAAASAVSALTKALKAPTARVRASAALALGNVGAAADPAVPALVAALKNGPEEVSWSAALALGRIGTPRARRAFARHSRESAGVLVNSP